MSKIGRPREAHVPTERAHCVVHGVIMARGYPQKRDSEGNVVRWQWRCLECRAENVEAKRDGYQTGLVDILRACPATLNGKRCVKPVGHATNKHVRVDGVEWVEEV